MANTRLRVVTSSELRTRRRCAREHHIAYELGIRSALQDAHALRFGTLVHTGLEAWWLAPTPAERLQCALAALPLDTDPFDLARATELLRGYDIRWRDSPLQVIELQPVKSRDGYRINSLSAVEIEFRAPLVNPVTGQTSARFELGGKIDALVLNQEDGRTYIVEHKTSGDDLSPGSDYWRALQLDAQVSTYYVGARALGFEPAGVVYDVLGKPQLRPRKATPLDQRKVNKKSGELYKSQLDHDETPDEFRARLREAIAEEPDRYFVRGTVVRFDDEEIDFGWDTWHATRGIQLDAIAQHWPKNPDACRRFGRMCSYFGACTQTESLDDPQLFRRVSNVHEELGSEQPPLEKGYSHATNDRRIH